MKFLYIVYVNDSKEETMTITNAKYNVKIPTNTPNQVFAVIRIKSGTEQIMQNMKIMNFIFLKRKKKLQQI